MSILVFSIGATITTNNRYLVHAATPAVIFVGLSISFDAGMPIDPLFLAALSVSATSLVIHTYV